jgi:ribosome-binding protein aMBF1 (putative translation factor)
MNREESENFLDHQDWNTIIVKKKRDPEKVAAGSRKKNPESQKLLKLEKKADNDELKHNKITKELQTKIQQGRSSKGLTQKQFANSINLPLQKIQEIENGKAIYNHKDINRIKRFLKI